MFTYKSILTILFFTFFLYTNHFDWNIYFINTLFAVMGLVSLFYLSKKELFFSGFFISVLWFWWIGYSFVYYDLTFLIPVIIISIGCLYGVLFYIIGLTQNILFKMVLIFGLSFINPFGFNWFKFELPLVNSYFGSSKIEFLILLFTISLFLIYKHRYQKQSIFAISVVFLSLYSFNNFAKTKMKIPDLNIVEHQTNIDQDKKWNKIYTKKIVEDNILAIKNAIEQKQDLIILPETAFPLVLNRTENLKVLLLTLSKEISIVTGSLYAKNGLYYNSTYYFENGDMEVAHKVVLVPFGEAVPMPEKIRNLINDIFYNGAQDYETAKEPTSFNIKGTKFRNAICYEATTDAIYKNLDTPYVIVISNNAWFTPSIQPTLQKLLLKYYRNKYNLYHFNVSNY